MARSVPEMSIATDALGCGPMVFQLRQRQS
jgi:hypothetical protein